MAYQGTPEQDFASLFGASADKYDWDGGWKDEWKRFKKARNKEQAGLFADFGGSRLDYRNWFKRAYGGDYNWDASGEDIYDGDIVQGDPNYPLSGSAASGNSSTAGDTVAPVVEDTTGGSATDIIEQAKKDVGAVNKREVVNGDVFFGTHPDAEKIAQDMGFASVAEASAYYQNIPFAEVEVDQNGNWVGHKVLSQSPELAGMRDIDIPGFGEWLEGQGYDMDASQGGMSEIIRLFMESGGDENDNGIADDLEGADAYAARNLGFGSTEDYRGRLSELIGEDGSIEGAMAKMQSDDITDVQARSINREAQMMLDESAQMVEGLGLASSSRALNESSKIISNISNNRLQTEMAYADQNQAKALVEYQALMGQYESLVDRGSTEANTFLDNIYQNRIGSLQGYATQIGTWIQEYGAELEGLKAQAGLKYDTIMASLGIESAATTAARQAWQDEVDFIFDQAGLSIDALSIDEANARYNEGRITEGTNNLLSGGLDLLALAVSLFSDEDAFSNISSNISDLFGSSATASPGSTGVSYTNTGSTGAAALGGF